MVVNLGFTNPQAKAVVIEINPFSKDKITKITSYGGDGIPMYTKLEGLQLSPSGIIKEFPDLKDKSIKDIKKIGMERFKKHLQTFKTEKDIVKYVKEELEKSGYVLNQVVKPNFRPLTYERYMR